jgi:hypothetical protein
LIGVKQKRTRKPRESRPLERPLKRQGSRGDGRKGGIRKFCVYLLGAAAIAAFVTNQYQVRTEAEIMAKHWAAQIRNVGNSGAIRKNTENYEHAVNDIIDKN